MKTIEMSYDDWYDEFKPTPMMTNPADIDRHFVWTAVVGFGGDYCVSEGIHFINRIHSYVSKVPWKSGTLYHIVAK